MRLLPSPKDFCLKDSPAQQEFQTNPEVEAECWLVLKLKKSLLWGNRLAFPERLAKEMVRKSTMCRQAD